MENNENNNFCTGNCLNCNFQQQVYCAAQHGHAIMNNMPSLFKHLENIEDAINKMNNGMIQLTDKPFINPLEGDISGDNVISDKDIAEDK